VLLRVRSEVFPAQTRVNSQVRAHSIVVSCEGAQGGFAQVACVIVVRVVHDGRLIWNIEQEGGEIVTRLEAGEVEVAAGIGIRQGIVLPALQNEAVGEGLLAVNLNQRIVDRGGLGTGERGRAIAEGAEVRERNVGRPVELRRWSDAVDAESGFDIRSVRKRGEVLCQIAAEVP